MPDREKVMQGLEVCSHPDIEMDCPKCPYHTHTKQANYCMDRLMRDAIALLKEQEARVMTLEEVKQHDNQDGCVWFEQPTYNAVAAFVRQDEECTEIISPYLLGEPINHGYMSNTFYAKAWRAWTSRPSPEQMREMKWEGEKD